MRCTNTRERFRKASETSVLEVGRESKEVVRVEEIAMSGVQVGSDRTTASAETRVVFPLP